MGELRPGQRLGDYEVIEEIAAGGMGAVYRARQLELDRDVAIKVILDRQAREDRFRQRFRREALHAAAVDHPNVVPIFGVGETDDGSPYLVMRYVEGTDLEGLVRTDGPLPPEQAVRIIRQVAAALDAAHARGLVHRDVKPGNVLLSGSGSSAHAYLTDFGLTKDSQGTELTLSGEIFGTPTFAAPEQMEGQPVEAPADVYALGCVLYFALTARRPFEGTPAQIMRSHLEEPLPSLPATIKRSEQLDRVIRKATAKAPAARFASAGDLAASAEQAFHGQLDDADPTVALPITGPGEHEEHEDKTVALKQGFRGRLAVLGGGAAIVGAIALGLILALAGDKPISEKETAALADPSSETVSSPAGAETSLRFKRTDLDSSSGATAVLPRGTRTTESFGDRRFRTLVEVAGSDSLAIVDYTPEDAPDPGDAYQPTGRTLRNESLGVEAVEYLSRGCDEGPVCVDYPLDLGGRGYGVLGAAATESEARTIARRAARSLSAPGPTGPFGTLGTSSIGPVEIGMTFDEVRARFGEPDDTEEVNFGGGPAPQVNWTWVVDSGTVDLKFATDTGELAAYQVDTPALSTASGYAVGGPVSPLVKQYGDQLTTSPIGGGNTLVLSENEPGSHPALEFFAPEGLIVSISGGFRQPAGE